MQGHGGRSFASPQRTGVEFMQWDKMLDLSAVDRFKSVQVTLIDFVLLYVVDKLALAPVIFQVKF